MLGKRSYVLNWDCHAGLWQVCSPSGHVVHESTSRQEISLLCTRLNQRFPRRPKPRPQAGHRATLKFDTAKFDTAALVRHLWSGVLPVCSS